MPSLSCSCVLRQSQSLSLTLSQKHELLQSHTLSLKLSLIRELREEEYMPEAVCPSCNRNLTPLEIIKGFSSDPNNFDTTCSGCGKRFAPKLRYTDPTTSFELPFYCDLQTQEKLRVIPELRTLTPSELKKKEPAIYHSAVVHCGTLRNAFLKVGIVYDYNEIEDQERKITPFLGKLPDSIIAEYSGLSQKKVSDLRKRLGIQVCTKKSMLEDIEEEY